MWGFVTTATEKNPDWAAGAAHTLAPNDRPPLGAGEKPESLGQVSLNGRGLGKGCSEAQTQADLSAQTLCHVAVVRTGLHTAPPPRRVLGHLCTCAAMPVVLVPRNLPEASSGPPAPGSSLLLVGFLGQLVRPCLLSETPRPWGMDSPKAEVGPP